MGCQTAFHFMCVAPEEVTGLDTTNIAGDEKHHMVSEFLKVGILGSRIPDIIRGISFLKNEH